MPVASRDHRRPEPPQRRRRWPASTPNGGAQVVRRAHSRGPSTGAGHLRGRTARRASPSAMAANCSMSSTPTPASATARITGIRRPITTGARPRDNSSMNRKSRLGNQRLGQHDHLLLSARQGPCGHLEALPEGGEQLQCALAPSACLLTGEGIGRDPDVVVHRQLGQETPSLWDDRHPGPPDTLRSGPGKVATVEQHRAFLELQHAGNGQDQARLARSVRAEQGGDLTGGDVDRDIAHHGPASPEHAQSPQTEHIARCRLRCGGTGLGRDDDRAAPLAGHARSGHARLPVAHATSSVPR